MNKSSSWSVIFMMQWWPGEVSLKDIAADVVGTALGLTSIVSFQVLKSQKSPGSGPQSLVLDITGEDNIPEQMANLLHLLNNVWNDPCLEAALPSLPAYLDQSFSTQGIVPCASGI